MAELQRHDQLPRHAFEREGGTDSVGLRSDGSGPTAANAKRQRWHRVSPGHPQAVQLPEINPENNPRRSDQKSTQKSSWCNQYQEGVTRLSVGSARGPAALSRSTRATTDPLRQRSALFGLGIAMFVTARLGLAPWDVFHQGVSHAHRHSGSAWVIELTGLLLLLLWIPLRQRPGVGTILNALVIGVVVDLDRPPPPVHRSVARRGSPTWSAPSS